MSAYTGAGFAQGFMAGAGTVDSLFARRQEAEMKQAEMAREDARYKDKAAIEREKMDRDASEAALDRGLKDREMAMKEQYYGAQAQHLGAQNALIGAQTKHYALGDTLAQSAEARAQGKFNAEQQQWTAEQHVRDQAMAADALKRWSIAAQMAQERGMPLPEMTPEVHKAAVTQFGEGFVKDPTGRSAHLEKVVQGLTDGSLRPDDPVVGQAMNFISPAMTTRGVGGVLNAPVVQDGQEVAPAGATIVAKEGHSLVPYEGGRFVPMVTVHAEKDGQRFSYQAPATVNGTSDPGDPVVTLSPDELRRSAQAQIGAGRDEAFIKGLQDYAAMTQSTKDREAAIDLRTKQVKLQQEQVGLKKAQAELSGKAGKPVEFDAKKAAEFFTGQFGEAPESPEADRFLTQRFPSTGYESVTGNPAQSATEQASRDAASAHLLNPDVPMDTITNIVSRGVWTRGKGNGGKIFWGYKAPTGEFMPVEEAGEGAAPTQSQAAPAQNQAAPAQPQQAIPVKKPAAAPAQNAPEAEPEKKESLKEILDRRKADREKRAMETPGVAGDVYRWMKK